MRLPRGSRKKIMLLLLTIIVVKVIHFTGNSTLAGSRDTDEFYKDKSKETKEREIEEMFVTRRRRIVSVCQQEGRTPPAIVEESIFPGKTVVDISHKIVYCAVQKVASTFLTDILVAINTDGKIKSPLLVKHFEKANYLVEHYEDFQKSRSKNFRESFMKEASSLLVVRDPFSRLLSAYTDKLYHPNHYFWRTTGKTIEKMFIRQKVNGCGNTVSFTDFIRYIVHEVNVTGSAIDPHFTPLYMHCDPCIAKYDYIMTFENIKDELLYMLNMWNTRFNLNLTMTSTDFEKETAIRIAEEHISMSFLTMKRYSRICNIPPYNFLLRTWRFLQISGVLPKDADFPVPSDSIAKQVTKIMFLDEVKKVLSQDIVWKDVKKQRHECG